MLRKFLFGSSYFCVQLWLGTTLFFSFILAPVLFKTFGGEMGADVMGALFPVYGILHLVCAAMGLVGLALAWRSRARIGGKTFRIGFTGLITALAFAFAQAAYVFPRSHELRVAVKAGRAAGSLDSIAPQMAEMMSLHRVSLGINNLLVILVLLQVWVFYRVAREWDKA